MRRVTMMMVMLVVVLALGGAGLSAAKGTTVTHRAPAAQDDATTDDLEQRIEELEEQVADLEDDVDDLEERLATLEARLAGGTDAPDPEAGDADSPSPADSGAGDASGGYSFTGNGDTGLDPIQLSAGTYRFSVTCDGGFFFIEMQPLGHEEFVLLSLVGMAPYEGSENIALDGGQYVISMTCQGPWTLDIEPLGGRG